MFGGMQSVGVTMAPSHDEVGAGGTTQHLMVLVTLALNFIHACLLSDSLH